MFDISPIQILIVLAIALLVFGPSRLPEMGRSIGRGLREFRGSIGNITDDLTSEPVTKRHPAASPAAQDPTAPPPDPAALAESAQAEPVAAESPAEPEFASEDIIVPGDQRH